MCVGVLTAGEAAQWPVKGNFDMCFECCVSCAFEVVPVTSAKKQKATGTCVVSVICNMMFAGC